MKALPCGDVLGFSRVVVLLSMCCSVLQAAQASPDPASAENTRGFLSVRDFGAKGDGVADDLPAFNAAIASMSPSEAKSGNILLVPFGVYRLSDTLHITRQMILQGVSGSGWYPGTTLLFDPGVTGIVVDRFNTSSDGGQGDWSVIRDIAIKAKSQAGTAHGIWLKARALIEDCYVSGFSGNGIEINASTSYTPKTNANNWEIHNCRIDKNGGHGVHVKGADTNAGRAFGVDSSNNGGWGFYDESFLGNTYIGCHAQANGLGGYSATNPNARSVFVGCYTEGGQPPNVINSPSLILGGMMGTKGTGYYLIDGVLSPTVRIRNSKGPLATTLGFSPDVEQGVLSFSASDGSLPYRLRYAFSGPGWWDFVYGNIAQAVPFSVSTSNAPEGDGQVRLNNGFYLNGGALERKHFSGTAPPKTGPHKVGEIIYNVNPAPGGYIGWVCTTEGSPGTWKPFGPIAP
jgi:pectate lyase-like protein